MSSEGERRGELTGEAHSGVASPPAPLGGWGQAAPMSGAAVGRLLYAAPRWTELKSGGSSNIRLEFRTHGSGSANLLESQPNYGGLGHVWGGRDQTRRSFTQSVARLEDIIRRN